MSVPQLDPAPATPTSPATPANASCPRCQAAFDCGAVGGAATCWCAQLPPLDDSARARLQQPNLTPTCWCPACLATIATSTD